MKKWIAAGVTLALMLLIFCFSARDSYASTLDSEQAAAALQSAGLGGVLPAWFGAELRINIRKWAHLCIYTALGASMLATVRTWGWAKRPGRQALLAAALSVLYSASDEVHQYFVPGRTMLFTDILVDGAGALAGILAALAVAWLAGRLRRRHG